MKYKKEYKIDMPQTIGETDSHFDLSNYCEWLENKYDKAIKELNEVHISLVMSSRLRKEIQNFVLNKWDTERDCNIAVKFAEYLESGISCEEISET